MGLDYDVTRMDWDAPQPTKPYPSVASLSEYDGVELHHGGSGTTADEMFRRIGLAHHRAGKWGGDIFYHVGLGGDGRLWELRGWQTRNVGPVTWLSRKRLTVLLPGNMEHAIPTKAQEVALRDLREQLRDAGGGTGLFFHGDRAKTACPGRNVRSMNFLPLRPKLHPERLDEIPVPGRWVTEGRWPMWVPLTDGQVLLQDGAPELETLEDHGIDRLAAPIEWAFFDEDLDRLVLVGEDGGTFALGVKGV